MKMCSRTSFEHLFKKDASFFFYVLGVFWTSKEIHKILGCKKRVIFDHPVFTSDNYLTNTSYICLESPCSELFK